MKGKPTITVTSGTHNDYVSVLTTGDAHSDNGEWRSAGYTNRLTPDDCSFTEPSATVKTSACVKLNVIDSRGTGVPYFMGGFANGRPWYTNEKKTLIIESIIFPAGDVYWFQSMHSSVLGLPTGYNWDFQTMNVKSCGTPSDCMRMFAMRGLFQTYWREVIDGAAQFDDTLLSSEAARNDKKIQVTCLKEDTFTQLPECLLKCGNLGALWAGYNRHVCQCITETGCAPEMTPTDVSGTKELRVYHWYEGYYFNEAENSVYILGANWVNDATIHMWVKVKDSCGNEAIGNVDFWVADSLATAAAQGRSCDQPDIETVGAYKNPGSGWEGAEWTPFSPEEEEEEDQAESSQDHVHNVQSLH